LVNGSILRQVEGGWATAIGCLAEAVVEGEFAFCLLLGSEVGEQLAVNVSKAKAAALGNRRQNLGITRSHWFDVPSWQSLSSAPRSWSVPLIQGGKWRESPTINYHWH